MKFHLLNTLGHLHTTPIHQQFHPICLREWKYITLHRFLNYQRVIAFFLLHSHNKIGSRKYQLTGLWWETTQPQLPALELSEWWRWWWPSALSLLTTSSTHLRLQKRCLLLTCGMQLQPSSHVQPSPGHYHHGIYPFGIIQMPLIIIFFHFFSVFSIFIFIKDRKFSCRNHS